MAAQRNAKAPQSASVRIAKCRQLIAVALLRSVSVQGVSNSAAARWLGISERTMFAWAHCEKPIKVEVVLACPQLRDEFRRSLCVHEHLSVPYVTRKLQRGQ